MASNTRSLLSWPTILLSLIAATRCAALSQEYCSTDNTGASGTPVYSIYMSNGLCSTTCAGYAFGVVQYQNCWCSNYIPADQVDVSSCSQKCPGYPQESCGNQNSGYFGYVALNNAPSGTAGGSAATTSSSSSSSSSQQSSTTSAPPQTSSTTTTPSPVTETATTTEVVTPSSTTSSTPSSTTSSTPAATVTSSVTKAPTTSDAPTTTPSTTATPTMVTNTQIVTISGAIVTQTVTSLPVPQTSAGSVQESPTTHKSSNTGAIVGGVVGGLAALFLILALLLFFLRRRNNQRPTTARKLDRNASILSKAGLLGAAHARDPEKSFDESNYGGQRHSVLYNDPESSPVTAPEGVYDRTGSLGRRNSKPLVYDQRLNPAALMENWQYNGSRSSINTMQDQRDYSRPLGITNPDPE